MISSMSAQEMMGIATEFQKEMEKVCFILYLNYF